MKPLHAGRPRHAPDSTLPLINIVLLLVLAFMIAGVIETPLPEGFTPLQSGSETPADQAKPPLNIVMTRSGETLLDGTLMAPGALTAALRTAAEEERGLAIKADSRAPAAPVIDILASAEDAGIENAVVMTIETSR